MQRIFVGDVQGCSEELEALIALATENFSQDFELWIAGDLVNRGPDNRRALAQVRELVEAGRGQYILGNHEIHLISVALGLQDLSGNDSIDDVLDAPDASEWVEWLCKRPLVATGAIEDQPFAMVHASVGPGWSLRELVLRGQAVSARLSGDRESTRAFLDLDSAEDPVREDLGRLTRGRAATDSEWSSLEPETPAGAWHQAWSSHEHEYGIVYGHWARQGLHVAEGLRGLDTGCIHHGRGHDGFLTAWLPDSQPRGAGTRPFDEPDDRFWQIPAKRRYYFPAQDGGK